MSILFLSSISAIMWLLYNTKVVLSALQLSIPVGSGIRGSYDPLVEKQDGLF